MTAGLPRVPTLGEPARSLFPRERRRLLAATGSTNDDVRDLIAAGEGEGAVVIADRQHAGRGRLGRSWFSPPGRNVHLSLLLRPALPPEEVPLLTLALAVAAHDAVAAAGVDAAIKWPNDLIVRRERGAARKLSGIHCEAVAAGGAVAVAAGIGVNVHLGADELPAELRAAATSIAMEGGRCDRGRLVADLLEGFAPRYERLQREGAAALLEAFSVRLDTLGREVVVDVGGRVLRGRAVGLGPRAELRLDTGAGAPVTISAGDVGL